ncbi:glycosyltransferase family 2 protein [Candidatus Uhrbacteria bacterium]|nr:glycosyltransferase family 2 protein [Candidatus Uhrbacteria bacterium]
MADSSQKDLAVVIVTWNVKDAVLDNLRSIFASSPMPWFDVVVVDNASQDGTVEAVRELFPRVAIIANKENLGFSKACNQGIAATNGRHVLLLNPDMRVEPDALAKTVAYLDQSPEVGVLGPKLINSHGHAIHHMRRFPTLKDQLATILKLPHLFPELMHRYHAKDLDLETEQRVDTVRGAYFAMNRSALAKVGILDERFYIWFEEVDYCKRVKHAGLEVHYVPSIVAHDLVGRSFAQRALYWKQKMFIRSLIRYFEKWHPTWEVWMLYAIKPPILGMAIFAEVLFRIFPSLEGKIRFV